MKNEEKHMRIVCSVHHKVTMFGGAAKPQTFTSIFSDTITRGGDNDL